MERSGDNIILLFLGQLDEVYCIAAYTDGQLRILFRMLLSVQQGFSIQYVYVQVVTAFFSIAVFSFAMMHFLLKNSYQTHPPIFVDHSSSSINSVG